MSLEPNTTHYRALEPYYNLELVDPETGLAALDGALEDFFQNLHRRPRTALRITMGSGKTRRAIRRLVRYFANSVGQRVEIYVPDHELAGDYEAALKAAGVAAKVVHVFPRTGGAEGKLPIMCRRPDYVKSLEAAKIGILKNACRTDDGQQRCQFYDQCPYFQQFHEPEPSEDQGNIVRIFVHHYLGIERNPEQREPPHLVIIDEAFLDPLVKREAVALSDVRRYTKTEAQPKLGRIICDALADGEPLLERLREEGVTRRDLEDVDLDDLRPSIPFDPTAMTLRQPGSATPHRLLSKAVAIIREELRREDRTEVERIVYDPAEDEAVLCWAKEPEIPDEAAVLVLDATADQLLVERVLGPVDFRRIDIRQRAWVTQVHDRTGSNYFWSKKGAPVGELVTVLNSRVAEAKNRCWSATRLLQTRCGAGRT